MGTNPITGVIQDCDYLIMWLESEKKTENKIPQALSQSSYETHTRSLTVSKFLHPSGARNPPWHFSQK